MKKRTAFIMAIIIIFTLTACGAQTDTPTPIVTSSEGSSVSEQEESAIPDIVASEPSDNEETTADTNRILVAYFSSAGNIATDEPAQGNVGLGNTKTIAELIQGQVDGDLFFIETAEKYPSNYDDTIALAMQELRDNARPALASHVENIDDYDVIFLGYPNWWGAVPQAVLTFVEEYDFSGKTIIPFCTYQDSGIGRSIEDLENALPDSTFLESFSVRQADIPDAEEDIKQWISELGLEI